MSFTVLSDSNVRQILANLSSSDVTGLVQTLEQALVRYSCNNEQQYQPHRAVVSRPDGQVSLFMPATTEQLLGVKIVGISPTKAPAADGKPPPAGLKSVLTLCDETGQAFGTLNAAALTAFRTALGSMLMYRFRRNTENIVVFGAGKQALWHVKLAILLKGKDIKKVTVVNRSAQRTQELVASLTSDSWPEHISLEVFDAKSDSLEDVVQEADVLFFTTPSTSPLFPASYLTSEKALKKTRFIGAIGSYRLDMQEIDPDLLRLVVDPSSVFSKVAYKNGIVSVDSRDGCLQEAGELVKADISPEKMLEIGSIFKTRETDKPEDLERWLEEGFVVYKSVGTGVMDLAIGQYLLGLARERKIGVTTEDF